MKKFAIWFGGTLVVLSGCMFLPAPGDEMPDPEPTGFANTTDKNNGTARYLGSSSCRECHAQIAEWHDLNGHGYKLTRVTGGPPDFPDGATRAGVPNPPDGFDWSDVSYVIGGYIRKARFINNDGFTLTTGVDGVNTQWNLDFPANGTTPGFVAYHPNQETPQPYGFSCFQCHVTGPVPQDEDFPEFQENRPGFMGTFAESGVQCESCHGPGSNHFTTVDGEVQVDRAGIFVDMDGAQSCNECHNRPFNDDSGRILASSGFIKHHEQWPELQASGGHASFNCMTCHDPHRSIAYDRENAIIRSCTDCHADHDMARHEGAVYVRGDYTESLSCESCHMPFASKSAAAASEAVVGPDGRMGDTQTHIFRINTASVDYNDMFTEDGSEVLRDAEGRAAVTLDFACLRCHNDNGNAFTFPESATTVAPNLHAAP